MTKTIEGRRRLAPGRTHPTAAELDRVADAEAAVDVEPDDDFAVRPVGELVEEELEQIGSARRCSGREREKKLRLQRSVSQGVHITLHRKMFGVHRRFGCA